jgi:hypothetical protein
MKSIVLKIFFLLMVFVTAKAQTDTVYTYLDIANVKHTLKGNTVSVELAEADKKYFKETYKQVNITNAQKINAQQLFAQAKADTASHKIDDTVYCPSITIQTKNAKEHFYINLASAIHQSINYLFDELVFNEKYILKNGENFLPIKIIMATDTIYTYYDAAKNRYELTNDELEYIPVNTKQSSSGIYNGGTYDSKTLNKIERKKLVALFNWAITHTNVQTNKNIKPNAVIEMKIGDAIKSIIVQAKAPINITINNYLKQLINK